MFFGGNFQLWKLHTAADYLSFFLFLLAGIAVFVVAAKCMNRRRNHETAVNKVMKRLGKLGKKPSRVYKNAFFVHVRENREKYGIKFLSGFSPVQAEKVSIRCNPFADGR